jgi:hypothetical protein
MNVSIITEELMENLWYLPRYYQLLLDFLALVAFGYTAYLMRIHIEIVHPVFAVLFQEVVLFCGASVTEFLHVLLLTPIKSWISGCIILDIVKHQFHQASWMVVTILRQAE